MNRHPFSTNSSSVIGPSCLARPMTAPIRRNVGAFGGREVRTIVVAATPERSAVVARMKEFFAFARSQGYRRDEVLNMMESLP